MTWGDYWGPESWGRFNGHWFEVWRPERVIFLPDPLPRKEPASEPAGSAKPVRARRRPAPSIPVTTRSWRRRHWLSIDDWKLDPHRSRWPHMRGDYGIPPEALCWWEDEPWEPDRQITESEILEARRMLATLTRDLA